MSHLSVTTTPSGLVQFPEAPQFFLSKKLSFSIRMLQYRWKSIASHYYEIWMWFSEEFTAFPIAENQTDQILLWDSDRLGVQCTFVAAEAKSPKRVAFHLNDLPSGERVLGSRHTSDPPSPWYHWGTLATHLTHPALCLEFAFLPHCQYYGRCCKFASCDPFMTSALCWKHFLVVAMTLLRIQSQLIKWASTIVDSPKHTKS